MFRFKKLFSLEALIIGSASAVWELFEPISLEAREAGENLNGRRGERAKGAESGACPVLVDKGVVALRGTFFPRLLPFWPFLSFQRDLGLGTKASLSLFLSGISLVVRAERGAFLRLRRQEEPCL